MDTFFLDNFIKKHQIHLDHEWEPLSVKLKLQYALKLMDNCKKLVNNKNQSCHAMDKIYDKELDSKLQEIEDIIKMFDDESKFKLFKERNYRYMRKRKRNNIKKIAKREFNKIEKHIGDVLNKMIDEWCESKQTNSSDENSINENNKVSSQNITPENQNFNLSEKEKCKLIARLEQLRRIRSQKLRSENKLFNDIQYIPTKIIDKDVMFCEEDEEEEEEESYFPDFYYQSIESLEGLINIRRQWDKYISKKGEGGTRIPIHFVQPPSNPSGEWKKYLAHSNF